jgi:CRP-like cAMP-binding protein
MRFCYPWGVSLPSISIARLTGMGIVLVGKLEEIKEWKNSVGQLYWQRRKTKMTTEEQISIKDLQGVDIFAGLSIQELELIAKVCKQRTYPAGECCCVQGEVIDELRAVNGGKVTIEMRIEVAPYTQTLRVATPTKGNVFAWSALVEPHSLSASARCIERAQVICIKASDLQWIFKERPSIERVVMKNLATIISHKLRDARSQLVRLVAEMIKQGK